MINWLLMLLTGRRKSVREIPSIQVSRMARKLQATGEWEPTHGRPVTIEDRFKFASEPIGDTLRIKIPDPWKERQQMQNILNQRAHDIAEAAGNAPTVSGELGL